MNSPKILLAGEHPRAIPPLSQSRHGDMACKTLYVCKHVQGTKSGEGLVELLMEGLTLEEVAERLGIRYTAAAVRIHRLWEKLLKVLIVG